RLAHGHFMTILDQQLFSQKEFAKVEPIAMLLYRKGQFTAAESIQRLLLTSKEQALGPDHPSTLGTVNNLGLLYADQGKLGEADRMYQRVAARYENAFQHETIPALNTASKLARLYREQGKTNEAEKMFQRAIIGKKKGTGI